MSGKNIISGVLDVATSTVNNTVTRLDPTRWQGYSHDELYKLLHDGPGATASALPTQRWTEIANMLADVDGDLRGALNRSADGWSGGAASAAYERLGTLATWADTAGVSATAMRDATQRQAENVAKARADMPAPAQVPPASPDPTMAPALQVLSLQGDQEGPDAASAAGEQSAHDVMTAYQLSTEATVESLGAFTAPERVTVAQDQPHGHGHGHGVLGLTSPSGLIGVITGNHGHDPHGAGHHGSYGGTSSSESNWSGHDNGSHYSPQPEYSGGSRSSTGFAPLPGGFGRDRDEAREPNAGRTSTPGTSGPVSGVELVNGPGGSSSVLGGPGAGSPGANLVGGANGAVNPLAGPHAASGANTASTALNPNEMPPPAPAAGPNGTMTANASGVTGTGGATGAQGAGADKLLGRRGFDPGLGGAGSLVAEAEPALPSAMRGASARRRDLRPQVRVTQTVSVDGEDVALPETVIGDGQRG